MKIILKSTWSSKIKLSQKTKEVFTIPTGISVVAEFKVTNNELLKQIADIEANADLGTHQKLLALSHCIVTDIYLTNSKKESIPLEVEVAELDNLLVTGEEFLDHAPLSFIDDVANAFFSKPKDNR